MCAGFHTEILLRIICNVGQRNDAAACIEVYPIILSISVTALSYLLTLSLLMSYIYGAPSKARNVTSCIYGREFLLGILLLEP
jgi:hypothetical protein